MMWIELTSGSTGPARHPLESASWPEALIMPECLIESTERGLRHVLKDIWSKRTNVPRSSRKRV